MSRHEAITTSEWTFAVWRGADMIDFRRARNILTDLGLREMALRSTAGTTSVNSHMAVGTGVRAESAADVALQTEVGRRPFTARGVDGTTERYTCTFSHAQLGGVDRNISEAGIFTQAAPGGTLIHRVTTDPVAIGAADTLTITTTVGHRNGTS